VVGFFRNLPARAPRVRRRVGGRRERRREGRLGGAVREHLRRGDERVRSARNVAKTFVYDMIAIVLKLS